MKYYYYLLKIFNKAESDYLVLYRKSDFKIKLKLNTDFNIIVRYKFLKYIFLEKAKITKIYIIKNLKKIFIKSTVIF